MPWSYIEGLENVNDHIIRMTLWPSARGHDITKVRFDGLIRFGRLLGHWVI